MLNVVVLPTSYPTAYNEHSSIFVRDQAEALVGAGVKVSVIGAIPISLKLILRRKLFRFGFLSYRANNVDVCLVLFPAIPKIRFFNELIRGALNFYLLKRHLKKNKIDVVHVHNCQAGKAALTLKDRYAVPYVVTEHSSAYVRNLVTELEIKRRAPIYKGASARIAVSDKFCEALEDIFHLNFNYVPNVVNTEFFRPGKRLESSFQFVNVANLNQNKNHILLVKAFAEEFRHVENTTLVILGEGPEHSKIEREIRKLKIQDKVKLYGVARREQVLEELQKSDVFVLASRYETFGVVLIEAMSCGLPVIATESGGPESIINRDYLGLLVKNDDLFALSSALKVLYRDRSRYNSDEIRRHVIYNYSKEVIASKLIQIFDKRKG